MCRIRWVFYVAVCVYWTRFATVIFLWDVFAQLQRKTLRGYIGESPFNVDLRKSSLGIYRKNYLCWQRKSWSLNTPRPCVHMITECTHFSLCAWLCMCINTDEFVCVIMHVHQHRMHTLNLCTGTCKYTNAENTYTFVCVRDYVCTSSQRKQTLEFVCGNKQVHQRRERKHFVCVNSTAQCVAAQQSLWVWAKPVNAINTPCQQNCPTHQRVPPRSGSKVLLRPFTTLLARKRTGVKVIRTLTKRYGFFLWCERPTLQDPVFENTTHA